MLGEMKDAQLMAGEIAEARTYTGVLYIGLGNQFDDDRRLSVRHVKVPAGNATHLRWLTPGHFCS